MEYTVGSIADLISGKKTPNKPKVVKRKLPELPVKQKSKVLDSESAPEEKSDSESFNENTKPQKAPKKSKKKRNQTSENEEPLTVIDHKVLDEPEEPESDKEADSDDDTDEDEIDDMKDEKASWKNPELKKEHDSRTLFVGNMPIAVKKAQLLRLFRKYGKIESVRIRCITPARPGIPKRVAMIKKLLHEKRTSVHSYVRFEKREDALKGLVLNGTKYEEHYLRVQICDDSTKPEPSKAIFVGNLPFDVEDDDLWNAFESVGGISSVRVVRNSSTGMGIGIGFVNFDSTDSVELALQLEEFSIKNKEVRIQRYHGGGQKKRKERTPRSIEFAKKRRSEGKDKPKEQPSTENVEKGGFQGNKSNKKKQRPKMNRDLYQKQKLTQKIAPR